MGNPQVVLSTKDIAAFFDVTSKTIAQWRKAGCPQIKRGQWDLKDVYEWYWENIAGERAAQQSGDESLNEAKRLTQWEKYKNERLKNQQLEGSLVTWDEVSREWAKRAAEYKAGCFELENSLPPLMEGKDQPEMRKTIYEKVWSLFDRVCRTGTFCPQQSKGKK